MPQKKLPTWLIETLWFTFLFGGTFALYYHSVLAGTGGGRDVMFFLSFPVMLAIRCLFSKEWRKEAFEKYLVDLKNKIAAVILLLLSMAYYGFMIWVAFFDKDFFN